MLQKLQQIKPTSFFVFAALVIELLLNIVTPPLQAPDEFSHFCRAYQIAEGGFLPVKADQRLGGYMTQGMVDFMSQHKVSAYMMDYTVDRREIISSCKIRLREQERVFQDFSNTAFYSPVSYLPQSLAIFILKKFGDKVSVLYYGGRAFTFLVWLLCMCFVIKTLPLFKWLFTLIILLPMHPYLVNSFSADAVTNMLCFLFVSIVLKHVFITERILPRHMLLLGLLALLLVLSKFVYAGIVFMLLMIPARKFKSKTAWLLSAGSIILASFAIIISWSGSMMSFYIPIKDYNPDYRNVSCLSPCGDYAAQQAYILQHGGYFFKVIYNSLFSHPRTYLSGYIGVYGNGDIGMPVWIYTISYLFICLVAITEKNNFNFTPRQKLLLFGAAMSSYVVLLLSIHLAWDCVGEGIVDLVQGRYLIPLFPLLFMLLDNRFNRVKLNANVAVAAFVCLLNLFACYLIYQRFFVGKPYQKQEIFCDVEEVDQYNAFKTSDYSVYIESQGCRTDQEHRSGSFSTQVSPQSPFCFTYRFSSISRGDIIELEAWEKGRGALLVVSGEQEGCEKLYFGGTYNSNVDDRGWQRIKNVYQVTAPCNDLKMQVYVWNPGTNSVFIDDFKITIKRSKS